MPEKSIDIQQTFTLENPKYKIIITADGTSSLFSNEYNEAMHTTSGAYQEALLKHVYPSMILECSHRELYVLDIGFGIGYNILALLMEFIQRKDPQILRVISLEKDLSYFPYMKKLFFGDERDVIYDNIKSALLKGEFNSIRYSIKHIRGDARDSIKELGNIKFDAIFHDPYSPSKNPEMWSVDFFQRLNKLTADYSILTTYSSAPQIRMALIEAGFRIGKGPSVGKKREGTLASRGGDIAYLCSDDIAKLKADIKSTPYRDRDLKGSRKNILNERKIRMRSRITK